ncbi:MAG: hypothetical protein ACTSYA_05980 [Candidatus Kariarchaeaceae archaeon]
MSKISQDEIIKFGSILIQAELAKEKQPDSLCFRFRDENDKTIKKIRNLEELSYALQELSFNDIIRHMPSDDLSVQDQHSSLFLWIGYILGDFNLAAKLHRIRSDPSISDKAILSQSVTTVWNRLLNYFEIDMYFQQHKKQ